MRTKFRRLVIVEWTRIRQWSLLGATTTRDPKPRHPIHTNIYNHCLFELFAPKNYPWRRGKKAKQHKHPQRVWSNASKTIDFRCIRHTQTIHIDRFFLQKTPPFLPHDCLVRSSKGVAISSPLWLAVFDPAKKTLKHRIDSLGQEMGLLFGGQGIHWTFNPLIGVLKGDQGVYVPSSRFNPSRRLS